MAIGENKTIQKNCIEKTEYSDLRIVNSDASSVFSSEEGCVTISGSFPYSMKNGIYSACNNNKYFTDYLLFAVNSIDKFIASPGIYASFSPEGIHFSIWTSNGRFSIYDKITNFNPDANVVIEFAWDWSSKKLGAGAKMAIFVNGAPTSSGNFPLASDSLSDIEMTILDNHSIDYNTVSLICDIVTYDSIPQHLRGEVLELSYNYLSNDHFLICGRDDFLLWNRYFEYDGPNKIVGADSLGKSRYSAASCDTSGDVYILSNINDTFSTGAISMFSSGANLVSQRLTGLTNPKAIAVTQIDGVDYPKIYGGKTRFSPYVWVADSDRIILTDHNLNVLNTLSGFSSAQCIVPLGDGRAWILDTGNNRVVLLSEITLDIEVEIVIESPIYGAITPLNDFYVYGSTNYNLTKISGVTEVRSISIGDAVTSIDIESNSGRLFVSYLYGDVKCYDADLNLLYKVTLSENIDALMVSRGPQTVSFYCVDKISMRLYRNRISDGAPISSTNLPPDFLFSGGLCLTSEGGRAVHGKVPINGKINMGFNNITNIDMNHFKVDQTNVDLSGGRENEIIYRDFGFEKESFPTDLRKGTSKGSRLPE